MSNYTPIDIIKKIGSYLPIAAVGIVCITFATGETEFKTFFKTYKTLSIIAGSLVIVLPIILPFFINRVRNYLLLKRNLTNTIIESQEILLDIYNNGLTAHYYEKDIFCKIGKKKNHTSSACMTIGIGGTIIPQSGLNCAYHLNVSKDTIQIEYINNSSTLNKYESLVRKQDKFMIFTAIFENAFSQKTEYWDIIPRHYCKDYNLSILLDTNTTLKSAGIYRIDKESQTETLIPKIPPIISKEHGRIKITMKIVDYDFGEQIRLKWEIN